MKNVVSTLVLFSIISFTLCARTQSNDHVYFIVDQETRSTELATPLPEGRKQTNQKEISSKTILNWMKNNKALTGAIITAVLAAGTTGLVYFCPDTQVSKFIKEKGTAVKDSLVNLPSKTWNFTKEHYIAIPASALALLVLGDLARGENSIVKKMLFSKQEKEKAEVEAALVATQPTNAPAVAA